MRTKPTFLMNEEGGSPGGGAAPPAAPPASTAAPEAPKYLTEQQLDEKLSAFQNGFFANARKAGLLKQDKPTESAPAPSAPAKPGQPEDPMAVLALRDAFDDATSELKLTKGQRSLLREHVMTRRPATGDVETMVSDYVSRAGWTAPAGVQGTTSQPPTQQTQAASPAKPVTEHPISNRGAPPPAQTPIEEIDLFTATESDRAAFIKAKGPKAYALLLQKQAKGRTVKFT